jgi:L-cysteine S-thiosulfotransferase
MAGSERLRRKFSAEGFVIAPLAAVLLFAASVGSALIAGASLTPYEIAGDTIPKPLTGAAGDPARGRAILVNRQLGLCLLCHSGPFPEERLQGSLAPSLAGVGSRYSMGQLRLRIVDASRVNPQTIMPPYYRTEGLLRVAPAFAGKSILNAHQIEDVVAFLSTLKEE